MPNRIIKESVCVSDSIDSLTWFEEVLFYRLIVNCDDFGRFDGRTAVIKNRLFPLKDTLTTKAVGEAVKKLASAGLVVLYVFEDKPYLYLPTWEAHQTIRAKRSKYPDPSDGVKADESNGNHLQAGASKCPRNPIQSNTNPNTNTKADSALPRRAYGEFGWVKLTEEEYDRLVRDFGEAETARCIKYVDESAQGNGNKNKWRDWNLVVRRCHRDGWGLQEQKQSKGLPKPTATDDGMTKYLNW